MHRDDSKEIRFSKAPQLARKLLSLALCLLLFGSLSLPAWADTGKFSVEPEKNAISYSDVDRNSSLYPAVQYLTNAGYMNGVGGGKFNPNGELKNAEIVTVFHRVAGKKEYRITLPYSDVPAGCYYFEAVKWAKSVGLTQYFTRSETLFFPNQPLARVTVAELLWRFARIMNWNTAIPNVTLPYTDTKYLSSDQIKALKWCYGNNIMRGTASTTFSPYRTLTRSQIAYIFQRMDKMVCQDTAFCVGTDYIYHLFGGLVDTSPAATAAQYCYQKMGYNVTCCLEPSVTTMKYSHNLRRNIVMLCGHGCNSSMNFQCKRDSEYSTGVCFGADMEDAGFTFAGLKGRMGLVDLIVFAGCETAKPSPGGRNLPWYAANYGAKVAIGWNQTVDSDDMIDWLEHFNIALAEGKTVVDAANAANKFYYGTRSTVKDWSIYYSDYNAAFKKNLKLNKSMATSSSDAALNSVREPKALLASYHGSRQLCGADISAEAAAVLAELDPAFRAEDYTAQLYDHGEAGITIDFVRLVGGFETDSIYTVFIENNTVVAVYDNTRTISVDAETKACSFGSPRESLLQTGDACKPAHTAQTSELTEALRLAWEQTQACPEKEASQQTYCYYYDLDRNQPCIQVFTDYYYNGTETKGLDLYVYDLNNVEEIS